MPLLNSAVAFLMNTTDGSKASLQTNYTKTTYLIQKDSAGVFKGWFMVLIADTAYVNGDFSKLNKNTYQQRDPAYSGRLMYFNINGKFAGGWRYQNGAITKTLTLTNAAASGGQQQINAARPKTTMSTGGCTVTPIVSVSWICAGNPTPTTASIRTNSVSCEPTYYVTGYILECSGGGGSSDGGAGGGGSNNTPGAGGNTSFPSPIEQGCKSVAPASVDGKQVNLQPPVPTTPDDPCLVKPPVPDPVAPKPPKIIMDSLLKNFPCAVRLILDKLAQNGVYGDLVKPFTTTGMPDLSWNNSQMPFNQINTSGGNPIYQLGETTVIGQSYNATINLNTSMLQNSSQLLIASVAIHETLHAVINYNLQMAGYNKADGNVTLNSWLFGIDSWYEIKGLPSNFSNHYLMMDYYFDQAVTALSQWGNNAHTTKEYQMTMLYGLNNPGENDSSTSAQFVAKTQRLKTEYNELLKKFSITEADLNVYWKSQLNSTTNKLPSSGCN